MSYNPHLLGEEYKTFSFTNHRKVCSKVEKFDELLKNVTILSQNYYILKNCNNY